MDMASGVGSGAGERNHPLAVRMAIIAGLSHNIVIGLLFGSFSVLMTSVEGRLGITRELSSLGVPLVSISHALMAPFVGVLAARYSLRWLLFTGAVLSVAGYAVLATTHSYPLYLAAYGLLLGPSMCLAGALLPPTLVTRWFKSNRGKALGLVHIPVVVAITPVAISVLLGSYGAAACYAVMAALTAVVLLPATLMVRDHPPGEGVGEANDAAAAGGGGATVAQIVTSTRFWGFAIAACTIMMGAVVLGTHLVPMAQVWGMDATHGATLAAIMSLAGIPGSILWGWIADKLGGGLTLTIAALGCAVLWSLLLVGPGFATGAVLLALLGMHGTAAIPVMGMALSEAFGPASFSRAFGLSNLITLPFTVIGVQAASAIYVNTGSYNGLILAMVVVFLVVAPLPFFVRQKRVAALAV
jgi:MFS family permease